MTTTTIHDQPVTDERAATTSMLDPRPTVTGPTASARTLAWIAAGVAVVAVLSALAAAGYRAYVGSDQPASAATVTGSSTRWDADSADAGPRSPHGVTTTAAHAVAVAGTAAAQRSLVDSAPPQRGTSEAAAITGASSLTVSASGSVQPPAAPMVHGGRVGLPQSRGTLIDG